jgi:hypothetical protein
MLQDGNKNTDCVYQFLQNNGSFSDVHSKSALTMLWLFLRKVNSKSLNIYKQRNAVFTPCNPPLQWPSTWMAYQFTRHIPIALAKSFALSLHFPNASS